MPSRRAFLAGAASVGVVGVGLAARLRLGPVAAPVPSPDAWPLARFDAANSAANRAAAVPSRPSVTWMNGPLGSAGSPALLADRERLYVARVGRTAAVDRPSGEVVWTTDAGGPLALSDGTLFVAPSDAGDDPFRLQAFDAATGEEEWMRSVRSEGPRLLATPDVVVFGGEAGLEAFDPVSGRRRWTDTTFREAIPAVAAGDLYALSGLTDGTVGRYRPRRIADVPRRDPPVASWTVDHPGPGRALAAQDDAVVGGFLGTDGPPARHGPGWLGFTLDGSERWRAVEPDGHTVAVGPLALAGGRAISAIRHEVNATAWRVEARHLADGRVDWSVGVDASVTDLAVAGETVLVGLTTTTLVALTLDGTERWRVDLPATPAQLVPVDGVIFTATPAGQVLALR